MALGKRFASLAWASCAALAFVVGCTGDAGPAGPAGSPGSEGTPGAEGQPGADGTDNPSVSAISPGLAYLERTTEVTISGYGTEWTPAAMVDFGPGISVDSMKVASPTAIVATISVDAAAALGPRDVSVREGENTTTYEGAFHVDAPLFVVGLAGSTEQGSILFGRAEQLDKSTPFDTTEDSPYPYLSLAAGDSSAAIIQSASSYAVEFLMFLDVNASTGPTDVAAVSGFPGLEVTSREPASFDTGARAPIPLTIGVDEMAMIPNAFDSILYSVQADPFKLVTIDITSTDPNVAPAFALLPSSGKFDDLITYDASAAFTSGAGGTYYVVVWDINGDASYPYVVSTSAADSDDHEPNDTCAMAQAVTTPAMLSNLSLSSTIDEDWFAITATAADVGSTIHVVTSPGNPDTDTWVDVLASDCMTSLGGPSDDLDYHEDFTSAPIPAAGIYYVKVYHSSFLFSSGTLYDLSISIDAPPIDKEPNDDAASASAAPIGMAFPAAISPAFDNDYFAVTVAAGQTITATVSDGMNVACGNSGSIGAYIDSEMEIYDTDGVTSLDFNEDIDSTNNYCSSLQVTVPAAGTYYVRVSSSTFYAPDGTFDYTLVIDVQ